MNWKNPVMKNTTVSPEKLIEIRNRANEIINTKAHLKKLLFSTNLYLLLFLIWIIKQIYYSFTVAVANQEVNL